MTEGGGVKPYYFQTTARQAIDPALAQAVEDAVPCYVSTCLVLPPGADRWTKICPDRPARWLAWADHGVRPQPVCDPCLHRWARYGNLTRVEALGGAA